MEWSPRTIGALVVQVSRGRKLAPSRSNPFGRKRLFCAMKYKDDYKYTSIERGRGGNRKWASTFVFTLESDTSITGSKTTVWLGCLAERSSGDVQFVGEAWLDLTRAIARMKHADWFPLHNGKRHVGDVFVELLYIDWPEPTTPRSPMSSTPPAGYAIYNPTSLLPVWMTPNLTNHNSRLTSSATLRNSDQPLTTTSTTFNNDIHTNACTTSCSCTWRTVLCKLGVVRSSDLLKGIDDIKSVVQDTFCRDSASEAAKALAGDEALAFEDLLHKLIVNEKSHTRFTVDCQRWIRKIAYRSGVIPTSLFVKEVERGYELPVDGGGFSDIYQGTLHGQTVALKVLRIFTTEQSVRKEFCLEALVWHHLDHKNILPLLGISKAAFAPRLCFVSPWMDNGNIIQYLQGVTKAIDRIDLLHQAAEGLNYLHTYEPRLVHGDIKGANLLINDKGGVCLTDFGLVTIAHSKAFATTFSANGEGGSVRWMAPELHEPDQKKTRESDCYAFGMTILEVVTLKPPYPDRMTDFQVLMAVTGGILPSRPDQGECYDGLDDDLWSTMSSCWSSTPESRPQSHDLVRMLDRRKSSPNGS